MARKGSDIFSVAICVAENKERIELEGNFLRGHRGENEEGSGCGR